MTLLTVENATVAYGGFVALRDVGFSVESGEYVCLVGANGAGKSSLLKAVIGLLPLQSGRVSLHLPRSETAYLPQLNAAESRFPATVREVVLSGRQRNGMFFYDRDDRASAAEAMEALGISLLKNQPVGALSGGQLQRVRLARALCARPKLLVLDEPAAGLDASVSVDLMALLAARNKREGMAILMATHDLHGMEREAKRVIALKGDLCFDGSPSRWQSEGRPGL